MYISWNISPDLILEDDLLQPVYENYNEPDPIALVCEHMFSFIGTDPDTMTL